MDMPRVTPTASVTFLFVGLKCSQPCYSEPDSNQIQFAWVFLGVTTPRRMACGWLESRLMAFFFSPKPRAEADGNPLSLARSDPSLGEGGETPPKRLGDFLQNLMGYICNNKDLMVRNSTAS